MSKFRKEYFCAGCDRRLSFRQKMYNNGCCPYCGNLVKGTVCGTVERSSEVKVAWTITKLKCVRALLAPLLRFHIKYINKDKK